MPIEFRCTQCGKLLRTPDETAGQQAKCPSCSEVMTVPDLVAHSELPQQTIPGQNSFDMSSSKGNTDSGNPYQAPNDYTQTSQLASTASMGVRPAQICISEVFGQTWNIFTEQWLLCIGISLLWLIILLSTVGVLVGSVFLVALATENIGMVIATAILASFAGAIFFTWLDVGLKLFFIRMARGLSVSLGDLFAGGPYLLRTLGASVLYSFGLSIIFGICILPFTLAGLAIDEEVAILGLCLGVAIALVPAVYIWLVFFAYSYLIIDQNLGIINSFSVSRRVSLGNRLKIFAIILVMGMAGQAICLVTCNLGAFVTIPFTFLLYAVTYLLMIGNPTVGRQFQQPVDTIQSPRTT